jgi:tRNA A-37 threonylcarbamoyl transferase component Bud32
MGLPAAEHDSAQFGRYRLRERIGAGGMAIVYRAEYTAPDGATRDAVIKRVLPELSRDRGFSSMLIAEARISARLSHPNIVQLYELGRVGEEYYLAMELVDGVDLVRLFNASVQARRPLPIALACHIVVELAHALAYAHDLCDNEKRPLSIVHRDVTPSNVMVTRRGAVKLLDFGVAKAAEHVRDERTRTGTLKGKVNYLSPESAEGLAIDRRTDIFALGIVFHECLTLKRLFKGEGDLQTLRLIREAKVAPPSALRPDVHAELDRVVLKMLARDPAERYADCHQLLAELEPIARELGGSAGELAQCVAETSAKSAAPPADEDMDAGPTPAIEIQNLLVAPPATPRRRWLWPALVALVALPALGIALVVGHHHAAAVVLPVAAAPVAPVRTAAPASAVAAPGLLVVETDVASARIAVDGRVVADRAPGARVPLAAGDHELTITASRRRPFARTLSIVAGGTVELDVKLERRRSKPDRGENYLVDPFHR